MVFSPFCLAEDQAVLRSSGLDGQMSGSEAWTGIVPDNPSAFPPSVEVMPNRRVP